jgi:hypothetical protein
LTQSFSLAHELLPLSFKLQGGLGALLGIPKGIRRLLLQLGDFLGGLLLHLFGRLYVVPPGLVQAGPSKKQDDHTSQSGGRQNGKHPQHPLHHAEARQFAACGANLTQKRGQRHWTGASHYLLPKKRCSVSLALPNP